MDWKTVFADQFVGVLLCLALIGFGIPIGLSLGIALDQFKINEAIANLWGGVLGAGLGAAGGVIGAVAIYRRQRNDQLRPLALPLHDEVVRLQVLLQLLQKHPEKDIYVDMLGAACEHLTTKYKDNQHAALGSEINDLVNMLLLAARTVPETLGTELNEARLKEHVLILNSFGTEITSRLAQIIK